MIQTAAQFRDHVLFTYTDGDEFIDKKKSMGIDANQ